MQEVKREILVSKSRRAAMQDGTVDRVLGWKEGEFDYDVTPAVFHILRRNLKKTLYGTISAEQTSQNTLLRKRKKAETKSLFS